MPWPGNTEANSRDAGEIAAIAGTVGGLLLITEAIIVDACPLDGVP